MQISNKQLRDFILDSKLLSAEVIEENFMEASEQNKKFGDLLLKKKTYQRN